jgi:NAD(P)-dependent dehydrogenase (short-subunit alcohol dehydrogenase family)
MHGKICLVTGATGGIGRAAAIEIAKRGATVVMVGRDATRGAAAAQAARAAAPSSTVEFIQADLSSQSSIRDLARRVKARYEKLHVLVNNAGGVFLRRELTDDGLERTFALNHLGYFLLTDLLLDRIKAAGPSRIVNVASRAHKRTHIDFENLQGEKHYAGFRAYGQSKLANVLFTYELARRLEGTGVTVNCLHPGVVSTGFGKNNPGWARLVATLFAPFLRTPEEGARTIVYLATSPALEGVSGKYFADERQATSSRDSYDGALARRLWEISEKLTRPDVAADVKDRSPATQREASPP